jgi:hypothetical protein
MEESATTEITAAGKVQHHFPVFHYVTDLLPNLLCVRRVLDGRPYAPELTFHLDLPFARKVVAFALAGVTGVSYVEFVTNGFEKFISRFRQVKTEGMAKAAAVRHLGYQSALLEKIPARTGAGRGFNSRTNDLPLARFAFATKGIEELLLRFAKVCSVHLLSWLRGIEPQFGLLFAQGAVCGHPGNIASGKVGLTDDFFAGFKLIDDFRFVFRDVNVFDFAAVIRDVKQYHNFPFCLLL